MKCDQAAEFVSALFDGERIPRDAAEHIGGCAVCGVRLQEYAVMSAELRRNASVSQTEAPALQAWPKRAKFLFRFWRKGTATMRIPRFAFVSLLLLLVALSAGLAITQSNHRERWFQYKLTGRDGNSIVTATVPTNPKGNPYYDVDAGMGYPEGRVWFYVRVLERVGDKEKILAKTLWVPRGTKFPTNGVQSAPGREFLASPEKDLTIPVDGYGSLHLNGHFEAVLPENVRTGLYPEDDKLRIYPPAALVRGNEMLGKADFGGGQYSAADSYFAFGAPNEGWYIFSQKPIEGWTQGTISANQIEFSLNGQQHFLLAGMPITFGAVPVWVKRYQSIEEADPSNKYGSQVKAGRGELAFGKLKDLASQK